MNLRKLTLLMLPVTVAFMVGGYAGSLIGVKEFQIAPALVWGLMIAIIDYNFSVIKRLSTLGWLGRIILIFTSAIITATIGDHIIFADTIAEKIGEGVGNNEEVLKLKEIEDLKKIEYSKALDSYNEVVSRDRILEKEIIDETNNGGCGPKCRKKEATREKLAPFIIDSRTSRDETKDEWKVAEAERKALEKKIKNSHNIIKEIQVLYEVIFESLYSMSIFILLTLMVICIETLPLLLKSGATADDIKREDEEAGTKGRNTNNKNEQTILRNNAY